ncbi:non-histone chromosomal protein HMG-14-like [Hyaena hyaena]|uniref:non-histone chromosomal protein HMG-14-like n=1 Tax=Hyaena hyaena TaxID=95912 RepID=UPI001920B540|nr:non-histone chromosomal protein HMG-14-like [Hyaena hyaena]
MPTRKISSAEGVAKEPKRKLVRFSTKPAPANVEKKPKKEEGKDTLQTKKKKKRKRKAKGKQAEVANQETKRDLPTENGKSKNGSLAFDEAGEKEAKSGGQNKTGKCKKVRKARNETQPVDSGASKTLRNYALVRIAPATHARAVYVPTGIRVLVDPLPRLWVYERSVGATVHLPRT